MELGTPTKIKRNLLAWSHVQRTRMSRYFREGLLGEPTPRPVIIMTTSRSGSTLLSELLVYALGAGGIKENLRANHLDRRTGEDATKVIVSRVIAQIVNEIDQKSIMGTKVIWDNFHAFEFLSTPHSIKEVFAPIFELKPVVLRLRREDRVAQAISRKIAVLTNRYHLSSSNAHLFSKIFSGSRRTDLGSLEYNREAILKHMKVLNKAEKNLDHFFSEFEQDYILISYEELVQQPLVHLSRITERVFPSISRSLIEKRAKFGIINNELIPTRSNLNDEWKKLFLFED